MLYFPDNILHIFIIHKYFSNIYTFYFSQYKWIFVHKNHTVTFIFRKPVPCKGIIIFGGQQNGASKSMKTSALGTSNIVQPNSFFNNSFSYSVFFISNQSIPHERVYYTGTSPLVCEGQTCTGCMKGVGIMRLEHSLCLSEIAKK